MGNRARNRIVFAATLLLLCGSFLLILICGHVRIPFSEVVDILFGSGSSNRYWEIIVLESRLPMALAALITGAALAPAGLILQTTFSNPLAGPSILGVSSGASLGVAILSLLSGTSLVLGGVMGYGTIIVGALLGAGAIILLLLGVSAKAKSHAMLLIIGILLSYLTNSIISLLTFLAPPENVKSFMVWGMGSFSGVSMAQMPVFIIISLAAIICSLGSVKPLNALLLGERYCSSMGWNVRRLRTFLLTVSGVLTAIVTAFCGPIAFIGIIVPHICRLATGTSNHTVIMPLTILAGAAITLFCAFLTVIPITDGVLAINTVTPIIGIPFILYIILRRL